jgi:uncharacterized membrane protein
MSYAAVGYNAFYTRHGIAVRFLTDSGDIFALRIEVGRGTEEIFIIVARSGEHIADERISKVSSIALVEKNLL